MYLVGYSIFTKNYETNDKQKLSFENVLNISSLIYFLLSLGENNEISEYPKSSNVSTSWLFVKIFYH